MLAIPQSTIRVVLLKLFTTATTTAATGKTLAITISKNGGAFGNPAAGASNATEVSNGWYSFSLGTTDTGTLGDLVVRGTAAGCDDSERIFGVVKATNAGLTALPDTASTTNASLLTSGSGTDQLLVASGKVVTPDTQKVDVETIKTNPVVNAGTITFPTGATLASTTNITAGTITTVTTVTTCTTLTNLPTIPANWLTAAGIATDAFTAAKFAADCITAAKIADGAIDTATFAAGTTLPRVTLVDTLTTYTGNTPQTGDVYAIANSGTHGNAALKALIDAVDNFVDTEVAAIKAVTDLLPDGGSLTSLATQASVNTIDDFLDTEVAAIKAKTDNLPASPAAVGSAMTLSAQERLDAADAFLGRSVATCEGTAAEHSLCSIVLATLESAVSGTTWTIKRTNGSTTHLTKAVTLDIAANPITGVA